MSKSPLRLSHAKLLNAYIIPCGVQGLESGALVVDTSRPVGGHASRNRLVFTRTHPFSGVDLTIESNCSRSGVDGRGSTSDGSSESECARLGSKKIIARDRDIHNLVSALR